METQEYTDQELDQLTSPVAEEIFPEEPVIEDQDVEDEINVEVDQTEAEPEPEPVIEVPVPTAEQLAAVVLSLQAQIDELRKAPKNQVAGTPGNRFYVRTGPLNTEGKIPQQQADLAKILVKNMPVGEKFSEAQVYAFLNKERGEYPQLLNSRQDVTYLFRYYRGLKRNGKHGGFIARGFLKQS